MLQLTQNSNYIIGSPDAIEALKTKKQARLLTVSDCHGQWRGLVRIIKQFGKTCDALLLLGDCWRDLQELLELANENKDLKALLPPVIAFVRGNGDPSNFPVSYDIGRANPNARTLPKGTVLVPDQLLLEANGHKILMVHGHLQGVDYGYNKLGLDAKLQGASTALHGHTHIPVCEQRDSCIAVRIGMALEIAQQHAHRAHV